MLFLVTPVLSTPLLKIPLLLTHAVCVYHGMTPPNQFSQRERIPPPSSDLYTRLPQLQLAITATTKYFLCGLALSEVAILLAQQLPLSGRDYLPAAPWKEVDQLSLRFTGASTAGYLFGIAGSLIRIWCHRTLGKLFTWQMVVRDDHKLITSGPYAVVRHPSYTGLLLMGTGLNAALLGRGSLFVNAGLWDSVLGRVVTVGVLAWMTRIFVVLLLRMRKEDELLRNEFSEEWEEWAKRTPYSLVPFFY